MPVPDLFPSNPYLVNPRMSLHYVVFYKDHCRSEDLDRMVEQYLVAIRRVAPTRRKEILLWRGEFRNSQYRPGSGSLFNLWSIGLPEKCNLALHDIMNDVIGAGDDYGIGTPDQVGCVPFLLITPDQIYQLGSSKREGLEGKLVLGGTTYPVRYLSYNYDSY